MSDETTDRILETLATPAAGENLRTRLREKLEAWIAEDRPGVVRPPFPLYLDDARTVAALLRTSSGEGEAQAQKVEAVLRRWNRLAGDVGGSEGPLTETEIAAISRDVAAALRSEAPGEEDAVRRTWELAVRRAYGCLDYCGGYHGAELKAFHSGIKTVIRALEAGLDTVDTQTAALDRIGAARRGEGGGE